MDSTPKPRQKRDLDKMVEEFLKDQEENEKKSNLLKWPNTPECVSLPLKKMPPFMKYYPSTMDMDSNQIKYYKYWRKEWRAKRPRYADLSYVFTYIYELLIIGSKSKNNVQEVISELDALIGCYPDNKLVRHVRSLTIDLLLYHEYYECALKRLEKTNEAGLDIYLNLKVLFGKHMDGKDLLNYAKYFGVKLYKATRENEKETIEFCEDILIQFQRENGVDLLSYISNRFDYEKRHAWIVSGGVPSNCVDSEYPGLKWTNKKFFNFREIPFFVEFVVRNVDKINKEIKYKNQKRKNNNISSTTLSPKLSHLLWKVKVHDSFKNPLINSIPGEKCRHEYLKLENHWEPYRKYTCLKCNKIFMCLCDRSLLEKVRPYKVKGDWLDGICPKCRGFNDASPITPDKLMYGSTFYAQHWREICFERDKMVIEILEKEGGDPHEISSALIGTHEPENRVRKRFVVPLIGEKWISETTLYRNLKLLFSSYEVIHHASPEWLGSMHLDVFIPEINVAFEYQGRQHLKPVDFFGGEEAFEKLKKRDKEKMTLCRKNSVKWYYINEGEDF